MSATETGETKPRWFTSSFSKEGTSCVEVRFDGNNVHVRDSKYRRESTNDPKRQPFITISVREWEAFLGAALGGGADNTKGGLPLIEVDSFGVTVTHGATTLRYTPAEWEAFTAGIIKGEFTAA